MIPKTRNEARGRRHRRLRQKLQGTAARPRMCVCLTGKHIYVQFVDDVAGRTLASASTVLADVKGTKANMAGAKKLGALAAEKARAKNITEIVFDRGGFQYHGRVKALADAAREAGLKF
ncbi:MAG: 50S ribosomal protein L18 [Verrucomicrobia bacterium]|nr:50S ribosomal protein L18 [Verrucomicrobiota bacterium]